MQALPPGAGTDRHAAGYLWHELEGHEGGVLLEALVDLQFPPETAIHGHDALPCACRRKEPVRAGRTQVKPQDRTTGTRPWALVPSRDWPEPASVTLLLRGQLQPKEGAFTLSSGDTCGQQPIFMRRSPRAPGTHVCGFGRRGGRLGSCRGCGSPPPSPCLHAHASVHRASPSAAATHSRRMSLANHTFPHDEHTGHQSRARGQEGTGPSVHFYFTCPHSALPPGAEATEPASEFRRTHGDRAAERTRRSRDGSWTRAGCVHATSGQRRGEARRRPISCGVDAPRAVCGARGRGTEGRDQSFERQRALKTEVGNV